MYQYTNCTSLTAHKVKCQLNRINLQICKQQNNISQNDDLNFDCKLNDMSCNFKCYCVMQTKKC